MSSWYRGRRRGKISADKLHRNERGLSLVEILAAVTIMAVISVTIVGYFVSALDRSAEENRRIIGANLAQLKAAEIREVFRDEVNYDKLKGSFASADQYVIDDDADPPADVTNILRDNHMLDPASINDTTYRYVLTFDNSDDAGTRKEQLETQIASAEGTNPYMIRMLVAVYWAKQQSTNPPKGQMTTIDTYVVKGR